MPRLDIDTSRSVAFSWVFLKSAGYSVSQIKNWHRQTILIACIFSYGLLTNWQAKHKEVNGDSITDKEFILHTKQKHTKQYGMRYCMQLNVSSLSVGQSIWGSIGTYIGNICKIIVYIQLILSFIKKVYSEMSTTFAGTHAWQFAWCGHKHNGRPFKYWTCNVIFTRASCSMRVGIKFSLSCTIQLQFTCIPSMLYLHLHCSNNLYGLCSISM